MSSISAIYSAHNSCTSKRFASIMTMTSHILCHSPTSCCRFIGPVCSHPFLLPLSHSSTVSPHNLPSSTISLSLINAEPNPNPIRTCQICQKSCRTQSEPNPNAFRTQSERAKFLRNQAEPNQNPIGTQSARNLTLNCGKES